jgi:hypothetical protein
VVVVDLETGTLDAVPESVAAVTWMPDGRSIGFLSTPTLRTFLTNGFFVREVQDVPPAQRTSVRLADSAAIAAAGIHQFRGHFGATMERSPSGRRLAIAAGRGDSNVLYVYNTTPSSTVQITRPDMVISLGAREPVQIEWSPDENEIAAFMIQDPRSSSGYSVQVIDLRTQAARLVTTVRFGAEDYEFGRMLKLMSWSR